MFFYFFAGQVGETFLTDTKILNPPSSQAPKSHSGTGRNYALEDTKLEKILVKKTTELVLFFIKI